MPSLRRIIRHPGMKLAAIALAGLFCASAFVSVSAKSPVTEQEAAKQNTSSSPAQTSPAGPQAAPSQATKTSSGQTTPAATKRPRRKKKAEPANCDAAPAGSGQPASGSAPAPADSAAKGTAPPAAASPSKNCPPSIVVVRQGGTSEPSIQLAGGTANDQTSHQRDADQLLGATDANLKKIADRQLTPTQQDMVSQVRQFMDQSKTARQSGDVERARTLAWKAELLSEELVKPESVH